MKKYIILCILFFLIGCENKIKTEHLNGYCNIMSLKTENNTEGDFFLGSGSIGSYTYNNMYMIISKDRYKLIKIPANITEIIETDKIEPMLQEFLNGKPEGFGGGVSKYELYIPKGSIIKRFNPNL